MEKTIEIIFQKVIIKITITRGGKRCTDFQFF